VAASLGPERSIEQRYKGLAPVLNEQGLRRFAATEAQAYGRGGVSAVSRITGIARSTISRGMKEIEQSRQVEAGRIRKPGGGRKAKLTEDSTLLADLGRLVEPATRGDPMRPLRWTSKSLRHLSGALRSLGHSVCPHVIADGLRKLGFSLQANSKTREGSSHVDRDAQFQYISDQAKAFLAAGEPVISVDTKKKELVGNFKNNGREWHPKGKPEAVNVHDFIDPKLGRAIPYGIYDIGDNKGWVSIGTDHDTASFAVHAIGRWWLSMGQSRYPNATRLLVTADGGGSNGHRVRLWKVELQALANTLRVPITVCHLPPGTSKWNKIEHRLFSFLTINWRGKPLRSFQTIVQLIAATTTTTGLTVRAELDENKYPKGVKTSDAKFAAINIARHPFHGDWNYTISPLAQ
jgi:Rhodopirellula transposase DDE domain